LTCPVLRPHYSLISIKKPEKPKEKKRRRKSSAAIAIPFPDGFTGEN